MNGEPIDAERCPLCGGQNDCGMAAGRSSCWCHTVTVPETIRKEIPAAAIDLACVCQKCLAGHSLGR